MASYGTESMAVLLGRYHQGPAGVPEISEILISVLSVI